MTRALFPLFPVFLILYEFCTNMSNDMYLPALPLIARDFTTQLSMIQLTITAWLAGDAAVQLLIGPLADRYGRRMVLLSGGGLFLVSTLACAIAPSVLILIVARFLQGIGVCTMMVAGYASIHDLYDDQKAIRLLAWMGSAAVIAPAIGPSLGSLLLLIAGWKWRVIFWVLAIVSAFSLIALGLSMPESAKSALHKLKVKTILARYRRIAANPHFMFSSLSFGLLYGGVIGWLTTSPYILMKSLQLSPDLFGHLQLPIFAAYIVGAKLLKYFFYKSSREVVILWGGAITVAAGGALVLFGVIAPNNMYSFVIPMACYLAGLGLASAPLNRTTLNATEEQKGSAVAMFNLITMGTGTLVSLFLSIAPDTILYSCLGVGIPALLSFALNLVRKRCT